MSTYTPTHCPETGRKFTKAERKAANKARYAAERAAQTPKPKRKAKPTEAPKPAMSEAALMQKSKAELVGYILGLREAIDGYVAKRDAETEPTNKPKRKKKPVKASKARVAVRKPKRSSADGLEQAQARTATANKVGKVKKTKVVHAVTGKEAQPFEPRMEVPVEERKSVKREQMRLTLLPGESPEQGIRRMKIQQAQAEAEAIRIEAEQLTMNLEA